MPDDIQFRHENKYLINRRDMDCCIQRIVEFARLDEHSRDGGYTIRSLYFDDDSKTAFNDKESGVSSRCKYRIRIYDMNDRYICLEKKIKEGSYVRKESTVLTRNEYDMILKGRTDFLLKREEKAANDFAIECLINRLKPEVIVDYERLPFVYDNGTVRITFDMNIRAVIDDMDIFRCSSPAYEVLGQDQLIMEVKYTEFLPDIFRAILPQEGCRQAVSKYVMCEELKMSFKEVY